jgi:hypothetical protein
VAEAVDRAVDLCEDVLAELLENAGPELAGKEYRQ